MNATRWKYTDASTFCLRVTDGTHDSPKSKKVGKPLITSKHIKGRNIDFENAYLISEDEFRKINMRSKVDQWDVLISMIGEYCGYCYVERNSNVDYVVKNVGIFKVGNQNKAEWLYYYLNSPEGKKSLASLKSGTSQPYLSLGSLRSLQILVPGSEEEMQKIVSLLSALDDKIELNRQTNATLEAMAQAIFKEWFVDFNYPGATGDLVDSELGLIPAGWRISTFEEELDAVRGLSYRGDGLEDKDAIPMHNLNSVYEGGGYKFEGIKYYSGEYKEKHVVKPGDLIIANTEQGHKYLLIGYPAIVPALFGEQGIYSHHIYRVRAKSHSYLTSDFLYFLLLLPEVRDQVTGFANGTTVNMLKIEGLQKPRFVLPPEKLVAKFSETSRNIRLRKEEMIKQSSVLAQIRDALLPKLMRGEIEI